MKTRSLSSQKSAVIGSKVVNLSVTVWLLALALGGGSYSLARAGNSDSVSSSNTSSTANSSEHSAGSGTDTAVLTTTSKDSNASYETLPITEADKATCNEAIENTVRPANRARLKSFCSRIARLQPCLSSEGRPIAHADSGSPDPRAKRIMVLGMIHGDEPLSGEMALEWEARLQTIDHRNSWRVIPMLNPDGLKRNTRMNANGVDLNRNFPTRDWEIEAQKYWKKTSKQDPRHFPGSTPASEVETRCVIAHIKDFKPDFVVSVHTPYRVLDFDGPRMAFPRFKDLPWRALGTFPGSLGRLMWKDYQTPVLTVELGNTMIDAAQLQDIVGTFAIDAARKSGQKTASNFEHIH